MTISEKLKMATALVDLGVDILEAGFPIASEGDFEAVDAVSRQFPMGPSSGASAFVHARRGARGESFGTCQASSYPHFHRDQRHSLEVQTAQVTRSRYWTMRLQRLLWRATIQMMSSFRLRMRREPILIIWSRSPMPWWKPERAR